MFHPNVKIAINWHVTPTIHVSGMLKNFEASSQSCFPIFDSS